MKPLYVDGSNLVDESGAIIAKCSTEDVASEAEANAAEIARRVNLHDELVAALRRARMVMHAYDNRYADDIGAVIDRIDAAKEGR
jgi:hypothetical protein